MFFSHNRTFLCQYFLKYLSTIGVLGMSSLDRRSGVEMQESH